GQAAMASRMLCRVEQEGTVGPAIVPDTGASWLQTRRSMPDVQPHHGAGKRRMQGIEPARGAGPGSPSIGHSRPWLTTGEMIQPAPQSRTSHTQVDPTGCDESPS